MLETIGHHYSMEYIMLTTLKGNYLIVLGWLADNSTADAFYRKLDFTVDKFSPDGELYDILSKKLKKDDSWLFLLKLYKSYAITLVLIFSWINLWKDPFRSPVSKLH